MNAIFADSTFWQIVGYFIGAALALVALALGFRYAAKQFKEAWWYVRVYVPQVVEQVDQPTDPALVYVGKVLEKVWPTFEENMAAALPPALRALADILDKVLVEPEREVVVGETAK
ncbi:MAG: hypothetical protein BroJett042_31760 [Bacteroidota bacterium]|nr:MAG: hypothetical protein BroJett042_31760 [Bacteroidota bacterium]